MADAFEENTSILCSGTIEFPCLGVNQEEECTQTGKITLPCGASYDVSTAEGGSQLPFRYQIYRERAKFVPCCFWRDTQQGEEDLDPTSTNRDTSNDIKVFQYVSMVLPDDEEYLPEIEVNVIDPDGTEKTANIKNPDKGVVGGWAHEDIKSFIITPRTFQTILTTSGSGEVPTLCIKSGAETWHQGLDGKPPCNGAKTSCPFYTGPTFEYIQDEHTAPGQSIKGQVVQEIRSYIKKWKEEESPQELWEQSFEVPYLWGRDFDDTPVAVNNNPNPDGISEVTVYTILNKIYWDVENEKVKLTKQPSAPHGTNIDNGGGLDAPTFPTFVDNLVEASPPDVTIEFPYLKESVDYSFIYENMDRYGNKIYMAGMSYPVTNVYIVNKNLISNFPDLINGNLNNEEVSNVIFKLLVEYRTKGDVGGFKAVSSGQDRFWQLVGGIDLVQNEINLIYSLVQVDNKWSFDYVRVNYIFHQVEVIQREYNSILGAPQTSTLQTKFSRLNTTDSVSFDILNIAGEVDIDDVYHYFTFDRSNARFLSEGAGPENERFWKVINGSCSQGKGGGSSQCIVEGSQIGDELNWRKLNNCTRYVVAIDDQKYGISQVIPAGLDRSWDPDEIVFIIKQEGGSDERIKMKVIDNTPSDFGRSYDGSVAPVNYIFIEPEDDQQVPHPRKTDKIQVKFRTFIAKSTEGNNSDDILSDLLDDFKDSVDKTAGGESQTLPSEGDNLKESHTLDYSNSTLTVTNMSHYDMSYMIEFKSSITQKPVGRKWVYGVAELADTWVKDVDIFYRWRASQSFEKLLPDYNKAIIDIFSRYEYNINHFGDRFSLDLESRDTAVHNAWCGDHDQTFGHSGPMFHPYDACDQPYSYKEDGGLMWNNRISYVEKVDEKYRGPDFQEATIYKHNSLGSLFSECWFEYSIGTFTRGSSIWEGYARVRGPISNYANPIRNSKYDTFGWEKPKFGNKGRDHIRVYRTMHFREYVYLSGGKPKVGHGWMPVYPYVGSDSLFSVNSPRTVFEQSIQDKSGDGSLVPDYNNYEDLVSLMEKSTKGSVDPDEIGGDLGKETFFYERKRFDDVYKVRKIRDKLGKGTRWPARGFYFNFRSPHVVWAHPEQEIGVGRDYKKFTTDFLKVSFFMSGLVLKLPTIPSSEFPIKDKYGRPIYVGFEEDKYKLRINEPKYDKNSNILRNAYVYIEDAPISARLYFDRFTGEILDKESPNSTYKEMYALDTIEEVNTFLEENKISTELSPFFKYVSSDEEEQAPKNITEDLVDGDLLDEYLHFGNLYKTFDTMYTFPSSSLESTLDTENVKWSVFFPALEVVEIFPKYLPKNEYKYDRTSVRFENLNPKVTYNSYPTENYTIRGNLSGKDLDANEEGVFTADAVKEKFRWKPYIKEDLINEIQIPDERKGYTGPVTIRINFGYPVEISHVEFFYEVYGIHDPNPNNTNIPIEPIPPEVDPSVTFTITDNTGSFISVLVDKERDLLEGYTANTLKRNFIFSYSENEDTDREGVTFLDEPLPSSEMEISFGSRERQTGLTVSNILLKVLTLTDNMHEEFVVIEPQYLITTGYYEKENELRTWSQDPQRLTGIVSGPDEHDIFEFAGIAEYWRPKDLSNDTVATQGKIRRHWASKYGSLDVERDKANPKTEQYTFFDSDVTTSEERQGEVIRSFTETISSSTFEYLLTHESSIFLLPQDLYSLSSIGVKNPSLIGIGSKIKFNHKMFDVDSFISVSVGLQEPGWQGKGFYACLDPATHTTHCQGSLGGRTPVIAYKADHGICTGSDGKYGILHRTLDLPMIDRRYSIAGGGSSAVAPTVQQDLDPNSLTQQALDNAEELEVKTRIERYYAKKRRYNP